MRFGIEEEFCFVDAVDYSLRNSIFDFFKNIEDRYIETQVKSELHKCIIETSTKICSTMDELENELRFLRKLVIEKSKEIGLTLISSGLHPFSPPQDAVLIEKERYIRLIKMGSVLADNVHFGMHIHIEEPLEEKRFAIINLMRYFIPEIISMSANSPFYCGRRTGFASTRLKRYDRAPSAGVPIRINNAEEFKNYIKKMSIYGVKDERDIYWDIRPRSQYGTIEVRVMDTQASIWQTIGVSAFILQLFNYIEKNYNDNLSIELPTDLELFHNRFLAQRDGINVVIQIRGERISVRKRIEDIADKIWQNDLFSERISDIFYQLVSGKTGAILQTNERDIKNSLRMLEDVFLL
ncbi:MAG: carboxylate-amine ligase [bacterium]